MKDVKDNKLYWPVIVAAIGLVVVTCAVLLSFYQKITSDYHCTYPYVSMDSALYYSAFNPLHISCDGGDTYQVELLKP